ncbi:MAG TPA: hypothetical protein PKD61_26855, partial [Polyangiaceae bacterium]|nr:hypothetical protein [Polyangiaceae bacterium]
FRPAAARSVMTLSRSCGVWCGRRLGGTRAIRAEVFHPPTVEPALAPGQVSGRPMGRRYGAAGSASHSIRLRPLGDSLAQAQGRA